MLLAVPLWRTLPAASEIGCCCRRACTAGIEPVFVNETLSTVTGAVTVTMPPVPEVAGEDGRLVPRGIGTCRPLPHVGAGDQRPVAGRVNQLLSAAAPVHEKTAGAVRSSRCSRTSRPQGCFFVSDPRLPGKPLRGFVECSRTPGDMRRRGEFIIDAPGNENDRRCRADEVTAGETGRRQRSPNINDSKGDGLAAVRSEFAETADACSAVDAGRNSGSAGHCAADSRSRAGGQLISRIWTRRTFTSPELTSRLIIVAPSPACSSAVALRSSAIAPRMRSLRT